MTAAVVSPFRFAKEWTANGPRLNTGSQPIMGTVDGRAAVLKGDRIHARQAVGEILASALAPLAGCRIPDWCIIELSREHPIDDGERIYYKGWIFVSFIVPDIREHLPAVAVLKFVELGWLDGCDLAAIHVFNQLILCGSNQLLYQAGVSDGQTCFTVYAIDHQIPQHPHLRSHIRSQDRNNHEYTGIDYMIDYLPCMRWNELEAAYARLGAISGGDFAAIFDAVPDDRGWTRDQLTEKRDLLINRARFLGANGMDILKRSPMGKQVRT